MLANILAGGKASRLYKRLVYELQIATQVAALPGRAAGSTASSEIFATARPGHDLNELTARDRRGDARDSPTPGPTPREVERVRNGIEAEFLGRMERVGSFGGKADQLNYYDYFVGAPDYFQRDLDRYRGVTAADVQRLARDYLVRAHRVVLSVVPAGHTELAATEGASR